MAPRIELLWWRGCPSWERAIDMLRQEMEGLGLDPQELEVREVSSEADAERERFPGSPTVRLNGLDIEPPGDEVGLTCRVYRLRDGRPSPLPDRDDVRDAIAAALPGDNG
jgi:hypothetical protein